MRTVTIGRGRATHLVQEPKEGRTRPLNTLCGITLMGEHTYPTDNRNLETFFAALKRTYTRYAPGAEVG